MPVLRRYHELTPPPAVGATPAGSRRRRALPHAAYPTGSAGRTAGTADGPRQRARCPRRAAKTHARDARLAHQRRRTPTRPSAVEHRRPIPRIARLPQRLDRRERPRLVEIHAEASGRRQAPDRVASGVMRNRMIANIVDRPGGRVEPQAHHDSTAQPYALPSPPRPISPPSTAASLHCCEDRSDAQAILRSHGEAQGTLRHRARQAAPDLGAEGCGRGGTLRSVRPADPARHAWHLDHDDSGGYLGPSHVFCNTSDGGKKRAAQLYGRRVVEQDVGLWSRCWSPTDDGRPCGRGRARNAARPPRASPPRPRIRHRRSVGFRVRSAVSVAAVSALAPRR
jgi:hypothetical protein